MNTKNRALTARSVAITGAGIVALAGTVAIVSHFAPMVTATRRPVAAASPVAKAAMAVPKRPITPAAAQKEKIQTQERVLMAPVESAYAAGHYTDAEAAAERVLAQTRSVLKTAPSQHVAVTAKAPAPVAAAARADVEARYVLAFSAARRHDLKLARERFADTKTDAINLLPAEHAQPDHTPAGMGQDPAPTLEESAAYQHAVCTAALGDKAGAEAEYVSFMQNYPDSPLVHAALMRIERMHSGDLPPAVEKVWMASNAAAQKRIDAKARAEAMCGPACLAELLRRRGEPIPMETLATEMKTGPEGTSMLELEQAVKQHGYSDAQGVQLTAKGFREQSLPLIALIEPGHYVVVDKVATDGTVTLWDSDDVIGLPAAPGTGSESERIVSKSQWPLLWRGLALTLGSAPSAASPVQGVAFATTHRAVSAH